LNSPLSVETHDLRALDQRVLVHSTSLMPEHFVFANVEQPQNSRPACWPVLARRSTMSLLQRGHFGGAGAMADGDG
jgi:hypothetical protein